MPWIEPLEDRTLLSTITWNNTAAQSASGGNWDTGSNWVGGVAPGPNDTAVIKGLTSPGTVYLDSGNADSISGLTTDSSTNLEVINGSLSLGVASSSTFGGSVAVESEAALNVGPGATVAVDSTLSDLGNVTFSTGDQVPLDESEISISGSLTASGTDFINTYAANITFNPTATYSGGSNTFNVPIYVPYTLVPSLANDTSFDQIEIEAGTISSGTLSLNLIGDNPSMSYVFPYAFTVDAGAFDGCGSELTGHDEFGADVQRRGNGDVLQR